MDDKGILACLNDKLLYHKLISVAEMAVKGQFLQLII